MTLHGDTEHEDFRYQTIPEAARLFALVDGIVHDEAGNVRAADVYFLCDTGVGAGTYIDGGYGPDVNVGKGLEWVRWHDGFTLHWHPFRLTLVNTARAGLHIVSSWRDPRNGEFRYGANMFFEQEGVLVMAPCSVVGAGRPLAELMRFGSEERQLNEVLRRMYRYRCGELGRPVRWIHTLPRSETIPPGWTDRWYKDAPV